MKKIAFCTVGLLSVFLISHSIRSEPNPIVTPSAGPTPVPGMIRIEVQSIYGKPVSDLKVAIYALKGPDGEKISPCGGFKEITPESTSGFVFEKELPPGQYRVEVTAPGWIGELLEKTVLETGEVKEVKFELQPGFMISGMVVDENGLPLPAAELTHRSSGVGSSPWFYSRDRKIISDSGGRFVFDSLREGIYSINAVLPGYIRESERDVATGTEDLRITIKKGFSIKGMIRGNLDGLDTDPRLELKSRNWSRSGKSVELDNRQGFVVSDLKKGIYSLRLKDGDYISDWVRGVEAAADAGMAVPVVLTAYRGGSISGRVTDSGTGLPIDKATVTLSGDTTRHSKTKYTDENGVFRFPALMDGTYELKVRLWHDPYSDSRVKKEIKVAAGQDLSDLNLEIDPGQKMSFSGRVVNGEGEAVSKAEVKLHYRLGDKKRFRSRYDRKTETDDDGNFTLSDYFEKTGTVKFTAAKKGYAQTDSQAIPLTERRDQIKGIVLKLNSGGSLEVEVEDEEGRGLVSAVVSLDDRRPSRGESVISIRSRKKLTDSRGCCRFDQLPFTGYTIKISKSDYSPAIEEIILSEEEPDGRVRVTLEAGRDIRVMVENERGEAIEGAEVSVRLKGTSGFITISSRSKSMTDSGGSVIFRDQSAETVVVEVKADGYVNSGRVAVEADREQVAITLKDAGSIKGCFLNADKKPVSEVRLIPRRVEKGGGGFNFDFFTSNRIDELGDGCFRIRNMAPGVYRITIKSPGLSDRKIEGVEVEAGEETDLGEIQFKPEGMISGRIAVAGNDILPERSWARVEAPGWDGLAFYGSIDGKGAYSIKGLPAGDYTVIIGAKHYKSGRIRDISLSSGEKKEMPVITLEKLTPEEELERKRHRNLIPSLGIRMKDRDEESMDFKSIRIDEVMPDSAAEKSGIRSGDTILKINGSKFSEDPGGFWKGLMSKPGTKLKIAVKRGESGEEEEVDLTVDDWSYEEMVKKWMGE